MGHCLVIARILPFLLLPLHPSPPPAPPTAGWIDWHLSCYWYMSIEFRWGDLPHDFLTQRLKLMELSPSGNAGGRSRRKGSEIFISRWTPVPSLLTTKRRGKSKLEENGNYHPLPSRKVERKRILGNITLESLPPRGAALFVNNLPSLNTVLSPFIVPKHH